MRAYASEREAIDDAARLAEGMTYKNALAGLPFGGGKAVIIEPARIADRRELFKAFGREVARLKGLYVTAEDVGTTPEDMRAVHSVTSYVSGIPREGAFGGDPARFTALGVYLGIETAVRSILKRNSLIGVNVAVQGVGAVGSRLCSLLAKAGCELWISDADPVRAASARDRWNAHVVSTTKLLEMPVDVLAPAATGGLLNASTIRELKTKIIAGAANNQLATLEDGDFLHARGIWYLPDFLVNAGGIISVAHEYLGTGSEERVTREVERIADRVERLISFVRQYDIAPVRLALSWAENLLARQ